MSVLKCLFLFSFFFSIVWYPAQAEIAFEDATFPELITSARAQAMGNAFIGRVDDASSAFYNPAGLGTVRYGHFHLSNFILEVNKDWTSQTTGGTATDLVSNASKGFSIDGARELLLENKGQTSHRKFQFAPNMTTRNFSLGYMYSMQTRAYLGKNATDKFEYADRLDQGPYAAVNLPLFGGIIKLGLSTIFLNRQEVFGESDPDTKISLEGSDYDKGSMFHSTAGIRITLPWNFLPTFALVSHNAFGAGWSSSGGAGAPEKIKNTYDLGVSLTPQIGNLVRIHFEANYKDALSAYSDVEMIRRVMLGMEIDIARTLFLRAGYGDGFGSAGLGIRTQKVELDLSTYARDLSNGDFQGKEDRRYVLGLSSGF
ncbi:MAG: hypothetical protein KAG61_13005 [Bacteriovoracaceae bacterium]|nr:hypothetical protein [Bacteriovoracaceae bacterium]